MIREIIRKIKFKSSSTYWEKRYCDGYTSGTGSYNKLAEYKAKVINDFIKEKEIHSIIDFGFGDGNQLSYFNLDNVRYSGYDVSEKALNICRDKYQYRDNMTFDLIKNYDRKTAELVMSLDVIYHLVEDRVFDDYMKKLFYASLKYVIIYSSNDEHVQTWTPTHVKHRRFSDWIEANAKEFRLIYHENNQYPYDDNDQENTTFAEFYIYEKE